MRVMGRTPRGSEMIPIITMQIKVLLCRESETAKLNVRLDRNSAKTVAVP